MDVFDLSSQWSQTNGTTVSLANASGANPTFTAPNVATTPTLGFELTVTEWHPKMGGQETWTWDVVSERHNNDTRDASNPLIYRLKEC